MKNFKTYKIQIYRTNKAIVHSYSTFEMFSIYICINYLQIMCSIVKKLENGTRVM